MNTEKRFISHMEEKYGEKFTYIGEKSGRPDKSEYTVELECDSFPGEKILVSQRFDPNDKIVYLDNYMAHRLHPEARERIKDVIETVCAEYWLDFEVPLVAFEIEDIREYDVDTYLSEAANRIDITVICYDAAIECVEQLIGEFQRRDIHLTCTVVLAGDEIERNSISDEDFSEYMSTTGWYDAIASFWIKNDGTLGYLNWG